MQYIFFSSRVLVSVWYTAAWKGVVIRQASWSRTIWSTYQKVVGTKHEQSKKLRKLLASWFQTYLHSTCQQARPKAICDDLLLSVDMAKAWNSTILTCDSLHLQFTMRCTSHWFICKYCLGIYLFDNPQLTKAMMDNSLSTVLLADQFCWLKSKIIQLVEWLWSNWWTIWGKYPLVITVVSEKYLGLCWSEHALEENIWGREPSLSCLNAIIGGFYCGCSTVNG